VIRKKYRIKISAGSISNWWRSEHKAEESRQEQREIKQMVLGLNDHSNESESNNLEQSLVPVLNSVELNKKVLEPEVQEEQPWRNNVVAGSFILYAMIEKSRFLNPFLKLLNVGENLNTRGSVERVLLTLFFLHALRVKSVEQTKNLSEEHFGPLVGGKFYRVQALRYAIDQIVEHKDFDEALTRHYQQLAIQTSVGDEIYYTDGHFSRYYGKKRIPMGFDTKRKSPSRGRNTVYLHNSKGHCVYFFESPTNTALSVDMRVLVEKMKELYGSITGKMLMFDRGGFSAKCFKMLRKEKMYFGTYLKNRKKEALIPIEQFQVYEIKEGGKKKKYRIFEKAKETKKYGVIRTIIFIGRQGNQIPIITSNPHLSALEIVRRMRGRWVEENSFKFMIEHYRFDLLTTYKTEKCPEKIIERPHPERKEINKNLSGKKAELIHLQQQLTVELGKTKNKDKVTIAEFETKQKNLRYQIKNVEVDIMLLEQKRNNIATKIEVNLADEHVITKQKRRLLINLMKCMNYNCEKWLQELYCQYHRKHDETLSMIRKVLTQPGRTRWVGDILEVELERLDNTAHAKVLDQSLSKLNDYGYLRLTQGRKLKIWQAA